MGINLKNPGGEFHIPEWLLKILARLFFIPGAIVLLASIVLVFLINIITYPFVMVATGKLYLVLSIEWCEWIFEVALDPWHKYCSFKED